MKPAKQILKELWQKPRNVHKGEVYENLTANDVSGIRGFFIWLGLLIIMLILSIINYFFN